jgi:hypothetical protein
VTKVSLSLCAFGVQDKDDALAALITALGADDVVTASSRAHGAVVSLRVVYRTAQSPEEARRTVRQMRNRVFFSNDSLVLSIR